MLQRLTTQLPEWSRPQHPAMRHTLGAPTGMTRRAVLIQFMTALVLLVMAVLLNSGVLQQSIALPISQILMDSLFLPTVFGQLMLSLIVMIYTSSVINEERRKQTWDTLRATRSGINLAMRARWSAAIFYRLSGFVLALYLVRLVLVGALVIDLTAFGGDYLALISGGGVTPQLPVVVVILLLALSMSASFILPLTGLGLDAAFGLLLSTFIQNRVFLTLAQVILGLARFAVAGLLFVWLIQQTDIVTMTSSVSAWLSMVGFGAFTDWGLRYLNLNIYSEYWAMVQYSIFVGAGLLVVAFAQALLADVLVSLAVRRGEARE
jgi:hypothetical protein